MMYLVPVAVMLCWMAVILEHFGDGALIDTLKTELPFSQLQKTPAHRTNKTEKFTCVLQTILPQSVSSKQPDRQQVIFVPLKSKHIYSSICEPSFKHWLFFDLRLSDQARQTSGPEHQKTNSLKLCVLTTFSFSQQKAPKFILHFYIEPENHEVSHSNGYFR